MVRGFHLSAVVLGVLCCSTLAAQDSDYVLTLVDVQAPLGATSAEVQVLLDSSSGEEIDGLQFGVCHDSDLIEADDAEIGDAAADAAFTGIAIYDTGLTFAMVMSFSGEPTLAPAADQEILVIDYAFLEDDFDETVVEFCEEEFSTNAPVYDVLVVIVDDNGDVIRIVPVQESGTISIGASAPTFTYTVGSGIFGFDAATGAVEFTVGATIEEHADSPDAPNVTHSFSMGLGHDPEHLEVVDVSSSALLDDLNDGDGPDFFSFALLEDGFTLGVVYSFEDSTQALGFEDADEVITISYETNADNLVDATDPIKTALTWTDDLGDPAVENTVIYTLEGDTSQVVLVDAEITLIPGGPFFVRGDCTADGRYNIGDPIALLGDIFSDADPVVCEDACDANDDGTLTLGDALALLYHQFSEGAEPEAPFPECGADPTADDALSCDDDSACR